MVLEGRLGARKTREKRDGFTVIELMVVLALAGLLMSIAAPLLNPSRWRADSAVQELMMSLNAAQRMAVLRQHDVIVTFVMDERLLRVHRDANNDGTVDNGEDSRVVELPETVGFSRGSAPPMMGVSSDVSFTDDGAGPRLVFHRNGSASESGTAYLRPMEGRMADDAHAARAITVERSTAQVRCYSYRSGSWEASC